MTLKQCVWLSKHPPTSDQQRDLRGYDITHLGGQYRTGKEAWEVIQRCCPRVALIVAILPRNSLVGLVHAAAPVPVVQPAMDWRNGRPSWTGTWRQIIRTKLITVEWKP